MGYKFLNHVDMVNVATVLVPPRSKAGESVTLALLELVGRCKEESPNFFSIVENVALSTSEASDNPVAEFFAFVPEISSNFHQPIKSFSRVILLGSIREPTSAQLLDPFNRKAPVPNFVPTVSILAPPINLANASPPD